MPKQYAFLGRPVPPGLSRRAPFLLAALALFAITSLLYTVPSTRKVPSFTVPKTVKSKWHKINPLHPPVHEPPRQQNDTLGTSSWYSYYTWLKVPFSSSVTLDENRSLLPVMKRRPPIYCYYDYTIEKDRETRDAESALLLTWRRAWWAQGFKPVILGPEEAIHNPMYEELQTKKDFDENLKIDVMRWLAWENMGGGLLSQNLLFPMGPFDDPLLSRLRSIGERDNFGHLTKYKDLRDGLFVGPKKEIAQAIQFAMTSAGGNQTKNLLAALPAGQDLIAQDDTPSSLAFYEDQVMEKKYGKVFDEIKRSRSAGYESLNKVINAHLHATWKNQFPEGISVLKPLAKHTTYMIAPAYGLAQRLSHCPDTPLPSSCPPNIPDCTPCVSSQPMKIGTPARFMNSSTLYTIGTVPHPYTSLLLTAIPEPESAINITYVRRNTKRDIWLADAMKHVVHSGKSSSQRVLALKSAIASDHTASRSLWFSAEREPPIPDDVDWHFGFEIPRNGTWADDGKSETPVPGPERRPPPPPADPKDGPVADPKELELEPARLKKAREMGKSKDPRDVELRDAVEAWNLADTEAWRFTRAFLARSRVERLKWEEEEARYSEGAGTEKGRRGGGWGAWLKDDT